MSEPTREQVLSEPAGPRMDAWVAEKVMRKPFKTPTHGTCCTCQTCGWDHDECKCGYSEYIGPAWEVWEHMQTSLFSVRQRFVKELEGLLTKTSNGDFYSPWPDAILRLREDIICRAALLATLESTDD